MFLLKCNIVEASYHRQSIKEIENCGVQSNEDEHWGFLCTYCKQFELTWKQCNIELEISTDGMHGSVNNRVKGQC